MSFLDLHGVQKRFGSHLAVADFTLAVDKGEFVSLLGPSGCGKTTTLQMIAGFLAPDAGRIALAGRDLTRMHPAERGLGIVFQSYALFPHMTAAENVAFGLEMRRRPRAERDAAVRRVLDMVGLKGFEDRYPRRMSGGQQQRVALARALVIEPEMLLLDEPLSNLDAKMREEMQLELAQLQRNIGTTTLLVTHDQHEAMALSDRIVVMNQGRIEQIGAPHDTYEHPATPFVASFLGKTNEFAAEVAAGRVRVGALDLAAAGTPDGPAVASVRPEKIAFADAGLPATIAGRVFQGSAWVYQLDTPAGRATATAPNDGRAALPVGSATHLAWREGDMVLRPAGRG